MRVGRVYYSPPETNGVDFSTPQHTKGSSFFSIARQGWHYFFPHSGTGFQLIGFISMPFFLKRARQEDEIPHFPAK